MLRSTPQLSALAVAVLLTLGGCAKSATDRRVVVLGIDGMDPAFLERHWGTLPNLNRLRQQGGFRRLNTTVPPQSPVAWSTFITGMDPGGHGIFDFVHRNPRTLELFSSLAETIEPKWKIPLGPWELPLSSGAVRLFRRGKAFWQVLSEAGVPVTVIRMPNNFPPVDCEGLSLAGMGTPDLSGTFGTFTYFTNDPFEQPRQVAGGRIVEAAPTDHHAILRLEGPANSLRRDRAASFVDIAVDIDPTQPVARFHAGDSVLILKEKEWSGWVRVRFPLMGRLVSTAGMFRIYVRELHPRFRVYVSPVNIDPEDPGVPLSTPPSYSRELARSVGPYYTQGIAEDTAALRQGALSPDEFVQQATLVATEHLKLLDYALSKFQTGLLFFHFFGVDQISHMFWVRKEPEVLAMYQRVDRAIGKVMERIGIGDLIVMSDHGFTSFDRAMHLNSWLRGEGLLTMKDETGAGLGSVDWSRTQAYAVGLNGLYLNQQGREAQGIVAVEHRRRIIESIRDRLLAARDEKGLAPVEAVYQPREIFHGGQLEAAPDLIVGYGPGYRASWQTALGQAPPLVFEDNTDAWIGDHCVAAHRVPGVFLSNRKGDDSGAAELQDVTATLLDQFGARPQPGMRGKSFGLRRN